MGSFARSTFAFTTLVLLALSSCLAQDDKKADKDKSKDTGNPPTSTACTPASTKAKTGQDGDKTKPLSVDDCVQVVFVPTDQKRPGQYLASWTNYPGDDSAALYDLRPNLDIDGFGSLISGTEIPEANGQRQTPNDTRSSKDIIVIHFVDSEQGDDKKVSVKKSSWYVYRLAKTKTKERTGKTITTRQYVSILKSQDAFPPILDAPNGFIISISRTKLLRGLPELGLTLDQRLDVVPVISYDVKITQSLPGNVTALVALLGGLAGATPKGQAPAAALVESSPVYGYRISSVKFNATDLRMPYTVAITANLSAQ